MRYKIWKLMIVYPTQAVGIGIIICLFIGFGIGRSGWEAWDKEAVLGRADGCAKGMARRGYQIDEAKKRVLIMMGRRAELQEEKKKKRNIEEIAQYKHLIEKELKDIRGLEIERERLYGTREALLWITKNPNRFRMKEVDRDRYNQIRRQLIKKSQFTGRL